MVLNLHSTVKFFFTGQLHGYRLVNWFLGAVGMIIGAMISGGGVGPFIDIPHSLSFLVVHSFCYVHNPATDFLVASARAKAYATSKKQEDVITRMIELTIARKDGMMALEGQKCQTSFLKKGFKCL